MLVSGTCIGAGMLALPVSTAMAGFVLSIFALCLVWAFTCFTGLLVVEINLWLPKGTSFISMAHKTLGPFGQALTFFVFIFLLYSLLAAYITGGGALLLTVFKARASMMNNFLSYLTWILLVGFLIYLGTFVSDMVNRVLMVGVLLSFSLLGTFVTPHIQLKHLLFVGHYQYLFLHSLFCLPRLVSILLCLVYAII